MISIFLLSFLISLTIPILYFCSFYYLLVAEIVPKDQRYIPKPNVGDNIIVYGVWVRDNKLSFLLGNWGWNEIHPVRYAKINGVAYGSVVHNDNNNYDKSLFDGVYDPQRLVVLNKHTPYRIASGKVMDVFKNTDGDYHVHILVDSKYRYLLKIDFVIFAYAWLLRVMSFILPFLIIVAYIVVSILKPKHTIVGRYMSRKFFKTKTVGHN